MKVKFLPRAHRIESKRRILVQAQQTVNLYSARPSGGSIPSLLIGLLGAYRRWEGVIVTNSDSEIGEIPYPSKS